MFISSSIAQLQSHIDTLTDKQILDILDDHVIVIIEPSLHIIFSDNYKIPLCGSKTLKCCSYYGKLNTVLMYKQTPYFITEGITIDTIRQLTNEKTKILRKIDIPSDCLR